MRLILTCILGLFWLGVSAQKVIIVDTKTSKEFVKEFPSRYDTIPGLAKNLKVYHILKKQVPAYDNLTERLVESKIFTDSIADGNSYPYCVYDYKVERLPDEVIKQRKQLAVINNEMDIFLSSVSDENFKLYTAIALAALIHQNRGGSLSSKQNEILDKVLNFGTKAYQNYMVKEKLINDIQNNPDVDITKDWK